MLLYYYDNHYLYYINIVIIIIIIIIISCSSVISVSSRISVIIIIIIITHGGKRRLLLVYNHLYSSLLVIHDWNSYTLHGLHNYKLNGCDINIILRSVLLNLLRLVSTTTHAQLFHLKFKCNPQPCVCEFKCHNFILCATSFYSFPLFHLLDTTGSENWFGSSQLWSHYLRGGKSKASVVLCIISRKRFISSNNEATVIIWLRQTDAHKKIIQPGCIFFTKYGM